MRFTQAATRVAGVLIALAVWQVAGMRAGDALLATPVAAFLALWEQLGDAELWSALGELLGQMLLGYALALVVGIPLGVGMGRSRAIEAVAKPWASMFVVMSAAALVPLFIILMGRGALFRTTIVFMVTVWYVVLTVYQAARGVSPRLLNVAVSFGASSGQRFRFVVLPALFPFLLVAARVGFTHALRAAVTAEMFISAGLGGLINNAGLDISTAGLFGLILVIMLLSIGATTLLRRAADWLAPWYASRTGHSS